MEKLFKIVHITLLVSFSLNSFAQKEFMVFKTEGTPLIKNNNTIKPLYQGDALIEQDTVVINEDDSLFL